MLRIVGKLSGLRSKKYSGGLPGTNSSQSSRIWKSAHHRLHAILFNLLDSLGPHQLAKPGGRSREKAVPHHSEPGRQTHKMSHDLPVVIFVNKNQIPEKSTKIATRARV